MDYFKHRSIGLFLPQSDKHKKSRMAYELVHLPLDLPETYFRTKVMFPLVDVDTCRFYGVFIELFPRQPTGTLPYVVGKYVSPKINIDIGTKILKAKCFGRKSHFPGTFRDVKP